MTGFGYNVHGFGAGGDLIITFSISSSTNDFNLLTHITNNFGYDGSSRVTINVTIDADVVIGSTSHTSPAFQTMVQYKVQVVVVAHWQVTMVIAPTLMVRQIKMGVMEAQHYPQP